MGDIQLRPWRAFLFAPLAAPVAFWAELLVEGTLDPARRAGMLRGAVGALGIVIAAGAPVAYAASIAAGLPLWWLARRGRLRLWVAVAAGALAGLVTALVLAPSLRGELISIPMGIWRGSAIGGISAVAWWRLIHARRTDSIP